MQIFLPYSNIFHSAQLLFSVDKRRFNKQIVECNQILNAISGNTKAWRNHPVTRMYEDDTEFLVHYRDCFIKLRLGDLDGAVIESELANSVRPDFLVNADWYYKNFKSRLFTKDPNKYLSFYKYGESKSNFYYVGGKWIEYKQ